MDRELRHIQAKELRVATGADGSRSISGYASVFNSPSVDFGGWTERVSPTAFNRTLQEKPDVLCLYSHQSSSVLGRTRSGTLQLEVDSVGLKFNCSMPDTTVGRDLTVMMERGDIGGCSFGFVCRSASWEDAEDGAPVRTLLDVDLYEVTITADPAYPDTSVSLRSAPKEIQSRIDAKLAPVDDSAEQRNRAHMLLSLASRR